MMIVLVFIIGILALISGLVDKARDKADKKPMFSTGSSYGIGDARVFIGVVLMAGTLISQTAVYFNMVSKESDYKVFDAKKEILLERQKNLVETLKFEAQKYVNYEKEIFQNLKPSNTEILFNAYPDLKAYESIRMVMDQITRLSDEIIKLELEKQEIRATFISINNNIFIIFRSQYE